MGILIHFLQLFERRMRVDLRRRHTLMAQQFLHTLQSGTIVQHGGGKRMAQHVRRPFFLSSNPRQTGIDDTFHLVSRHSLALVVLAIILLFSWMNGNKTAGDLKVTALNWVRNINIEKNIQYSESGWALPAGAELVDQKEEYCQSMVTWK